MSTLYICIYNVDILYSVGVNVHYNGQAKSRLHKHTNAFEWEVTRSEGVTLLGSTMKIS